MTVYTKDPVAILDYTVDWSTWLVGGETIVSATWTVPAGLTKVENSNTTTSATARISGGQVGSIYELACVVVTSSGQSDRRVFSIICGEK